MQATETGTKQNIKDEGSINFRPSPNFKHMKKYLKSKFEEDMSSSSSLDSKESELKHVSAVQPPLPPNSPPPDSPLGITVKKEVEDDEYEQNKTNEDTGVEKKKAVMCKDFVRKTCARGASCIYSHELDVSQLKGVYRFCRDFENSRCDRRVCYFVHATTFEKEHFFRTGDLPPHALAHLKPGPAAAAAAAHPAAPLATQLATSAESQRDLSAMISNPPPQSLPTGSVSVQPVISCVAAAAEPFPAPLAAPLAMPLAAALAASLDAPPPPAPAPAPGKREWRDIEDFSSSSRDLDSKVPLAKKCKHCDLTELRLQGTKAQVDAKLTMLQNLEDRLELESEKIKLLSTLMQIFVMPKSTLDLVNNKFPRHRSGGNINKDMIRMLLTNILINGHGGSGLSAAADYGLSAAARDRAT